MSMGGRQVGEHGERRTATGGVAVVEHVWWGVIGLFDDIAKHVDSLFKLHLDVQSDEQR